MRDVFLRPLLGGVLGLVVDLQGRLGRGGGNGFFERGANRIALRRLGLVRGLRGHRLIVRMPVIVMVVIMMVVAIMGVMMLVLVGVIMRFMLMMLAMSFMRVRFEVVMIAVGAHRPLKRLRL